MDMGMKLHVQEPPLFKSYGIWFLSLLLVAQFSFGIGVKLDTQEKYVVMDNGLVQVTLSKPDGIVTGIRYNGVDNLLETKYEEDNRGYWDLYWNEPGGQGMQEVIEGTEFKVILENEDQLEVSFIRPWNPSQKGSLCPLSIDKRFIMLKGSNGFYTYSIYEHMKGWPDFNLNNTRMTFKLGGMFQYMAVDNIRQGIMPSGHERDRGKVLQFKEAVLIDPPNKQLAGQVDDKYQWSNRNDEIKVHGWVSNIAGKPLTGFWQITPSFEFRSGGPFKQELTSHAGPISLTVFFSAHYMGQDRLPFFRNGEAWKKVYGPVFIYLNSAPPGTQERALWDDANNQLKEHTRLWPYSFPVSEDFVKSPQRCSIHGRLLVQDRYIKKEDIPAASAYVGLALPGEVGSWQTESKGYQFWTVAAPDGSFNINNVVAGTYNLYATVPGFIGDYMLDKSIIVAPGEKIELGDLVYTPPRTGPTLWEIGVPDRLATEYFIPDPDPKYFSSIFKNNDRFRQYGLWDQYSVLYPTNDLVYTIDKSDYKKDWFFAQVTRKSLLMMPGCITWKTQENIYQPTTWQIKFNLKNVQQNGLYALRVAIASSSYANFQVRFNELKVNPPHFSNEELGKDNAIARHGDHGLYTLLNIDVQGAWLVQGENVIFLTQSRNNGPFDEIMYDYIRFEGPTNTVI